MKIVLSLLFIISSSLIAQVIPKGNWVLVSRNNYRIFEIKEKDIIVYTSKGFQIDKFGNDKIDKKFKILETKVYNGQTFFHLSSNDENEIILFNQIDSNHLKINFFEYKEWSYIENLDTKMKFEYNLVSEKELVRYDKLRSLETMSDLELIIVAKYAIEIKKNITDLNRHYLFSQIKYKLIELGINPKFQLNSLFEKMSESKNVELIKLMEEMKDNNKS